MTSAWNCAEARAAFSPAWDDQLEAVERQAFDRHLAGCRACCEERGRHDATLAALGPALHRLVDRESPLRPFPEREARTFWLGGPWLKPVALALSALAVGFIAIDQRRQGLVLPPIDPVRTTLSVHERPCPWHPAQPEEVQRSMSYPVIADPCLGAGFELVEAEVKKGAACDESVRLTYRSGARTLVLEQHPERSAAACPAERVVVDRVAGCLEHSGAGATTALVWSHGEHGYRLEGDVAPGEAVAVARSIAESLGEP